MKKSKKPPKTNPKKKLPKIVKQYKKRKPKVLPKKIEPKCKNCLLADREKGQCKVAILVNGKEYHMPIFPEDLCHMDQLGIPVEQVRWFVTDPKTGKPTSGNGTVQIEYPQGFFGKEEEKKDDIDELLDS
jgi:hypothetical protein